MNRYSRKPAVAVMVATLLAAGSYVYNTRADVRAVQGPALAELERAIANPDAGMETWMAYADRLLQERRYAHAAAAYERVLETDPYSWTANLQCATALGQAGAADPFHDFLTRLLSREPRLALDILSRPVAQSYLRAERFQLLLQRAKAQSMD